MWKSGPKRTSYILKPVIFFLVGNIIGAELGFWRGKFIWPGNIYWLGGPGLEFAIKRKKEVKRNTSLGFVVLITKSTVDLPWFSFHQAQKSPKILDQSHQARGKGWKYSSEIAGCWE